MKYIPLGHGQNAMVDDEDYEWLIRYNLQNKANSPRTRPALTAFRPRDYGRFRRERTLQNKANFSRSMDGIGTHPPRQ